MLALWRRQVTPAALSAGHARWLITAAPVVNRHVALEVQLAARYLALDLAHRLGEVPPLPPLPEWTRTDRVALPEFEHPEGQPGDPGGRVRLVELDPTEFTRNSGKFGDGPVSTTERLAATRARLAARINSGTETAEAVEATGREAASAALTMAQRAGQRAYAKAVRSQRVAVAWRRWAEPSACTWCRMLEWRGPVYRRDNAGFDAHNHCRCVGVAVLAGETYQTQVWRRAPGRSSVWVPAGDKTTTTARSNGAD
ncbi:MULTISPECIES: hypothetical protein [unclassified Crossiella]|uniref:VG15 protein n=1 Tax=unclassified Crossiella TaxID=2620835 RepID=UPI001FFF590C|nr:MULTISPECIES: hypothetical protein [unclassified Crossiella]MCK2242328.1 hypothetical protein [Crossiella sp. S99.2]MCK2254641.1 hypothetical protein [Crossiella sp. S99.1]